MKKYKLKKNVFATIATLIVVTMLLVAGPASAINIRLYGLKTGDDEYYQPGELVTFNVIVEFEQDDFLLYDVEYTLKIGNDECNFKLQDFLSNPNFCSNYIDDNVIIGFISTNSMSLDSGFGYGYGYDGFGYGYFTRNDWSGFAGYGFAPGLGYGHWGYGYGYGYQSGEDNKIIFQVVWYPPMENLIDHEISFRVNAPEDSYFTHRPLKAQVTIKDWETVYANDIYNTLIGQDINNTLDQVTNLDVGSFEGLWFENNYGRIEFNDALNLTNENVQILLQNLNAKFGAQEKEISLDAEGVDLIKQANATLTMFNVPDSSRGYNIEVNGETPEAGKITGLVYNRTSKSITFKTDGFSTFTAVEKPSTTTSTSTTTTTTAPAWNVVTDAEANRVLETLGIEGTIEKHSTPDTQTITLDSSDLSKLSEADRTFVESALGNFKGTVTLTKTAEVYRIRSGGSYSYYTLMIISVESEGQTKVVEVIPKTIASDVSEIIFETTPNVLRENPIVEWTVNKGDEIKYYLPGQWDSDVTLTSAGAEVTVTPEQETPVVDDVETPVIVDDYETTEPEKKSLAWLWILLGVLVIGGLLVFLVKNKKE